MQISHKGRVKWNPLKSVQVLPPVDMFLFRALQVRSATHSVPPGITWLGCWTHPISFIIWRLIVNFLVLSSRPSWDLKAVPWRIMKNRWLGLLELFKPKYCNLTAFRRENWGTWIMCAIPKDLVIQNKNMIELAEFTNVCYIVARCCHYMVSFFHTMFTSRSQEDAAWRHRAWCCNRQILRRQSCFAALKISCWWLSIHVDSCCAFKFGTVAPHGSILRPILMLL